MVQKYIGFVSPPASKQKVCYIVMSAFYETKKKKRKKERQICYTVCYACQRFSSTHTGAKVQMCSIIFTETTCKTEGVLDLTVTHRQTDFRCVSVNVKSHRIDHLQRLLDGHYQELFKKHFLSLH